MDPLEASEEDHVPVVIIGHVPQFSCNEQICLHAHFTRSENDKTVTGVPLTKNPEFGLFAFRLTVAPSKPFDVRLQRWATVQVTARQQQQQQQSAAVSGAEDGDGKMETITVVERRKRRLKIYKAWTVVLIEWDRQIQKFMYSSDVESKHLFVGKYPTKKFPSTTNFCVRSSANGWQVNLADGCQFPENSDIYWSWIDARSRVKSEFKMVATIRDDRLKCTLVIWEPLPFMNKVLIQTIENTFFVVFSEWGVYDEKCTVVGLDKPLMYDSKEAVEQAELGQDHESNPVSIWQKFLRSRTHEATSGPAKSTSDTSLVTVESLSQVDDDTEVLFCTSCGQQDIAGELEKYSGKKQLPEFAGHVLVHPRFSSEEKDGGLKGNLEEMVDVVHWDSVAIKAEGILQPRYAFELSSEKPKTNAWNSIPYSMKQEAVSKPMTLARMCEDVSEAMRNNSFKVGRKRSLDIEPEQSRCGDFKYQKDSQASDEVWWDFPQEKSTGNEPVTMMTFNAVDEISRLGNAGTTTIKTEPYVCSETNPRSEVVDTMNPEILPSQPDHKCLDYEHNIDSPEEEFSRETELQQFPDFKAELNHQPCFQTDFFASNSFSDEQDHGHCRAEANNLESNGQGDTGKDESLQKSVVCKEFEESPLVKDTLASEMFLDSNLHQTYDYKEDSESETDVASAFPSADICDEPPWPNVAEGDDAPSQVDAVDTIDLLFNFTERNVSNKVTREFTSVDDVDDLGIKCQAAEDAVGDSFTRDVGNLITQSTDVSSLSTRDATIEPIEHSENDTSMVTMDEYSSVAVADIKNIATPAGIAIKHVVDDSVEGTGPIVQIECSPNAVADTQSIATSTGVKGNSELTVFSVNDTSVVHRDATEDLTDHLVNDTNLATLIECSSHPVTDPHNKVASADITGSDLSAMDRFPCDERHFKTYQYFVNETRRKPDYVLKSIDRKSLNDLIPYFESDEMPACPLPDVSNENLNTSNEALDFADDPDRRGVNQCYLEYYSKSIGLAVENNMDDVYSQDLPVTTPEEDVSIRISEHDDIDGIDYPAAYPVCSMPDVAAVEFGVRPTFSETVETEAPCNGISAGCSVDNRTPSSAYCSVDGRTPSSADCSVEDRTPSSAYCSVDDRTPSSEEVDTVFAESAKQKENSKTLTESSNIPEERGGNTEGNASYGQAEEHVDTSQVNRRKLEEKIDSGECHSLDEHRSTYSDPGSACTGNQSDLGINLGENIDTRTTVETISSIDSCEKLPEGNKVSGNPKVTTESEPKLFHIHTEGEYQVQQPMNWNVSCSRVKAFEGKWKVNESGESHALTPVAESESFRECSLRTEQDVWQNSAEEESDSSDDTKILRDLKDFIQTAEGSQKVVEAREYAAVFRPRSTFSVPTMDWDKARRDRLTAEFCMKTETSADFVSTRSHSALPVLESSQSVSETENGEPMEISDEYSYPGEKVFRVPKGMLKGIAYYEEEYETAVILDEPAELAAEDYPDLNPPSFLPKGSYSDLSMNNADLSDELQFIGTNSYDKPEACLSNSYDNPEACLSLAVPVTGSDIGYTPKDRTSNTPLSDVRISPHLGPHCDCANAEHSGEFSGRSCACHALYPSPATGISLPSDAGTGNTPKFHQQAELMPSGAEVGTTSESHQQVEPRSPQTESVQLPGPESILHPCLEAWFCSETARNGQQNSFMIESEAQTDEESTGLLSRLSGNTRPRIAEGENTYESMEQVTRYGTAGLTAHGDERSKSPVKSCESYSELEPGASESSIKETFGNFPLTESDSGEKYPLQEPSRVLTTCADRCYNLSSNAANDVYAAYCRQQTGIEEDLQLGLARSDMTTSKRQQSGNCEGNAGEDTQPEENVGEDTQPEENVGEDTQPEENVGEDTQPEENVGEDTQAEENVGEDTQAEENVGEDTQPEENVGEDTQAHREHEKVNLEIDIKSGFTCYTGSEPIPFEDDWFLDFADEMEENQQRLKEIFAKDPEFQRIFEGKASAFCSEQCMDYVLEDDAFEDSKEEAEPVKEKYPEQDIEPSMEGLYSMEIKVRPPSPFADDWFTECGTHGCAMQLAKDTKELEEFIRERSAAFDKYYEQVLAGTCTLVRQVSVSKGAPESERELMSDNIFLPGDLTAEFEQPKYDDSSTESVYLTPAFSPLLDDVPLQLCSVDNPDTLDSEELKCLNVANDSSLKKLSPFAGKINAPSEPLLDSSLVDEAAQTGSPKVSVESAPDNQECSVDDILNLQTFSAEDSTDISNASFLAVNDEFFNKFTNPERESERGPEESSSPTGSDFPQSEDTTVDVVADCLVKKAIGDAQCKIRSTTPSLPLNLKTIDFAVDKHDVGVDLPSSSDLFGREFEGENDTD